MAETEMPAKWSAEQKLFPHQVGFTCSPFDYDAAPSDFLSMCNFRSGRGGLPRRPIHLARAMEEILGKPIIGHDTALYWRIMKHLGIAPTSLPSLLLERLHA
ncbi:MAG: hypothetical protein AAF825_01380 [Pseudomonadota bacterium]